MTTLKSTPTPTTFSGGSTTSMIRLFNLHDKHEKNNTWGLTLRLMAHHEISSNDELANFSTHGLPYLLLFPDISK